VSTSSRIVWTNKSVLKFAGDADPISLIEEKARQLVLQARDAGWSGPPYNPVAIADLLRIPVEASGDVADARTVASERAITIEFNPTRPRERVRFSIAHEIAHTLFPDVADQTRHRGGAASTTDEWQLEMLCNLAAAEFVMPVGSLPPTDQLPRIEELMCDRRKFDVSAEAFLIRVVKTTAEPALMFCASPIKSQHSKLTYRVDYSMGSKSSLAILAAGLRIPSDSIVYSCTAIGQTNRATESWITKRELPIECVGIPAFPGTVYPRIAGIVRFSSRDAELDAVDVVHGDVLSPIGTGPKVICQLVNDQARTWGGGVARSAAQKYPAAQQQFSQWIVGIPKRERLGQVHFAKIGDNTYIASLVAQEGYGASKAARIRYAPLERCFCTVAKFAMDHGAKVNLPRIGAGQSGGSWDTVEEIIWDTLIAKGVRVTIYDLPPRRLNAGAELLV
jgi:Zn-dependent peptidase ImmA (M78 family)/O-acetyl-ADP-ribose deacetylase (regulator of RNase III)